MRRTESMDKIEIDDGQQNMEKGTNQSVKNL